MIAVRRHLYRYGHHQIHTNSSAVQYHFKKRLDPLFFNPSNPTLTVLSRFYKGSEMAMYNTELLAQESRDLQTEIDLQECKKKSALESLFCIKMTVLM